MVRQVYCNSNIFCFGYAKTRMPPTPFFCFWFCWTFGDLTLSSAQSMFRSLLFLSPVLVCEYCLYSLRFTVPCFRLLSFKNLLLLYLICIQCDVQVHCLMFLWSCLHIRSVRWLIVSPTPPSIDLIYLSIYYLSIYLSMSHSLFVISNCITGYLSLVSIYLCLILYLLSLTVSQVISLWYLIPFK